MSNNKQTAVEWLVEHITNKVGYYSEEVQQEIYQQAKEMEKQQINNLPIHIHEGIKNTWVYIEDGVIHVKPNTKKI